jgi:subfamily B ATP-binding cassette protein MsbA
MSDKTSNVNDYAAPQDSKALVRRLVKTYLMPHWGLLSVAIVFMVASALLTASFAKVMEPVMDEVLGAKKGYLVAPFGVAIFAIFTLNGLMTYGYSVVMNLIGQNIVAQIQYDLFKRFVTLDLAFFHDNPSGQLVARVINDVNAVRSAVGESIIGIGKSVLTLILLVGLMFYQDWHLALIAFCAFPIAGAFVSKLGRKIRKISRTIQSEVASLTDILSQIFLGMRQVKAYGREDYEIKRASDAIWRVRRLNFKGVRVGNLSTPINETLLGAALMFVVMYGGYQVVDDTLTLGSLISFITAFALAYEPLRKLAKTYNNMQMGLGAADRIFEMMDRQAEIQDKPDAQALKSQLPEIAFKNVTFNYRNHDENALENINFTAKAGGITAFVGASGSGKTTIMNMVPRFYDVTSGVVTIDGKDIRDYTLESLRNHMALVSQDITIFDDTARANIAYGRLDATDEEVFMAAKLAAADEFILNLSEGYNTRLGEAGVKISGGQKQRIAIARAILRDAPILLLDEATSALDNESERSIQTSLEQLQKGRTTLVIAHRLSTIRKADKIIVMDKGRIIEEGTHDSLMALGGAYARMNNDNTLDMDEA